MILALVLALASPSIEGETDSSCTLAISDQRGRNFFELSTGSKACEEEGREADAAFLEVLARIRVSADLILLPPEDLLELSSRSDFREVFAVRGQFVDEELARDPERFVALLDRVRTADLSIPAAYDPAGPSMTPITRSILR